MGYDCSFTGVFCSPARSVEDGERPFALGMQFVLLRTLGKSNSSISIKAMFSLNAPLKY